MLTKFYKYFNRNHMSVIGMIHVKSLPATPLYDHRTNNIQKLVDNACNEAEIYVRQGIHGILVENMFDRPYINCNAGPEIVATMTRICTEIRRTVPKEIPCGIQILAGLNHEALAVALSSEFQFIRVEGFVFSHVADEGLIQTASAGPLLRYRRLINAEHILVLTDIKKKHCSHSITDDVNLVETAKAARFFLTDGIIITGKETGDPPSVDDIEQIDKSLADDPLPIIIGSGVDVHNVSNYLAANTAAVIVGSHFKHDGKWYNELCESTVKNFMQKYNKLIHK